MPTVTIGDNTADDFAGTEDTRFREASATSNYGSATTFAVAKWSSGVHDHSAISFSGLSNIPASATVSAASLNLYLSYTSVGSGVTCTCRRLLRDWVEGQATWNVWKTSNNWTTGGALSAGNDRSATTSGTILMETPWNVYRSNSDSQLVTDVQNFIDGTNPNYGWHLERTDSGNDAKDTTFRSSEGTDGQRPSLSVTYTTAGGMLVHPGMDGGLDEMGGFNQ